MYTINEFNLMMMEGALYSESVCFVKVSYKLASEVSNALLCVATCSQACSIIPSPAL